MTVWVAGKAATEYADAEQAVADSRFSPSILMATKPTAIPDFSRPDGLITAVAQDATSGQVLMVAHMNQEAWEETLSTGQAVYYSRSRSQLWRKGETSGHVQQVRDVLIDCDGDTVLLKVDQGGGAACHEGYRSCFYRRQTPSGLEIVAERVFNPDEVYGQG